MKYNTNKKMTRGAKRTLNDFMCTMFTMLSEKNFEEITVGDYVNMQTILERLFIITLTINLTY